MERKKTKRKAGGVYGSAKRDVRQIVESKEAHQLGAKAKETMNSAGRGAKRVIGAPGSEGCRKHSGKRYERVRERNI